MYAWSDLNDRYFANLRRGRLAASTPVAGRYPELMCVVARVHKIIISGPEKLSPGQRYFLWATDSFFSILCTLLTLTGRCRRRACVQVI